MEHLPLLQWLHSFVHRHVLESRKPRHKRQIRFDWVTSHVRRKTCRIFHAQRRHGQHGLPNKDGFCLCKPLHWPHAFEAPCCKSHDCKSVECFSWFTSPPAAPLVAL